MKSKVKTTWTSGLNPLNQVYVFNDIKILPRCSRPDGPSLNPLNQVYVFNQAPRTKEASGGNMPGLNPLNQVYVFNGIIWTIKN